jgi:hypothetical protein
LFEIDFLILQGLKSAKYSSKIQENFVHYFTYYLGEYLSTRDARGAAISDFIYYEGLINDSPNLETKLN